MNWETLCRRTNDPKLLYIERTLSTMGIAHKREGESAHAPILKVPSEHLDAAWEMLSMDISGRTLDEIPDDDPMFQNLNKCANCGEIIDGPGHYKYWESVDEEETYCDDCNKADL